jgi:hypothetical protein
VSAGSTTATSAARRSRSRSTSTSPEIGTRSIGEQSEAAAQKSFLIEQGNDWRAVLSQLEPNAIALLCVDESDATAG